MEILHRVNLINSISGIKPANLIGTISKKGHTNLAIFGSVVHLGSNPALFGMICKTKDFKIDTLNNIKETGVFTINHIEESFIQNAHFTSIRFQEEVSEFEVCKFEEEYIPRFKAPFVKASRLKLGLKYKETLNIRLNDTHLIIGELQHLIFDEQSKDEYGHINLSTLNNVGISGRNTYYKLEKIKKFSDARINEVPDLDRF